ncbi:MAG TPA: RhuM family protein [Chitinophagaceae bacterium]|jgi:death-on-curing family protein
MEKKGEILIYRTQDGKSQLEVKLEQETVWLTQAQMNQLFVQTRQNISLHINNIFKEKELDKKSVVKESLTTATDGKQYKANYYNLDVIISVGYRIKSKRGTQFRIWATQTLRDHLVKGYTINERRLSEQQERLKELGQAVDFIRTSVAQKEIRSDEAKGLLEIIAQYTRSFILLNQFDRNNLEIPTLNEQLTYEIRQEEAITAIEQLKKQLIEKKEASQLFGRQKDGSFKGILQNIIQTFDGTYLYPAIEEQAAHLLYFTIKSHPFIDGNKRIGAFLFIWFLQRNKHLLRLNGHEKINDNTLVALALLVAQSDPATKELMIRLIINLVNE